MSQIKWWKQFENSCLHQTMDTSLAKSAQLRSCIWSKLWAKMVLISTKSNQSLAGTGTRVPRTNRIMIFANSTWRITHLTRGMTLLAGLHGGRSSSCRFTFLLSISCSSFFSLHLKKIKSFSNNRLPADFVFVFISHTKNMNAVLRKLVYYVESFILTFVKRTKIMQAKSILGFFPIIIKCTKLVIAIDQRQNT